MSKITKLEYRVRKVERYIITRYVEHDDGGREVGERGEHANPDQAWETAYALCKLEHEQHTDIPPFDERVQYPCHPNEAIQVMPAAGMSAEGNSITI